MIIMKGIVSFDADLNVLIESITGNYISYAELFETPFGTGYIVLFGTKKIKRPTKQQVLDVLFENDYGDPDHIEMVMHRLDIPYKEGEFDEMCEIDED